MWGCNAPNNSSVTLNGALFDSNDMQFLNINESKKSSLVVAKISLRPLVDDVFLKE